MLWGALAQSIPDIDFVAGMWMETSENLLAHRGFTHSILFGLIITPLFALTADRVHRPHDIPFWKWILFFGTEVFVHLFIDGFNNYGVGWLEPFSHNRFSFHTIYVADPFFSIMPAFTCAALFLLPKRHRRRRMWWKLGIGIPIVYLAYCWLNKWKIDSDVRQILAKQRIEHTRYFTTPAPLQNWLWFVVAGNDSGYHVGFRSLFDAKRDIHFEYFPRNAHLLEPVNDHPEVQRLIRFSQQYYTVERWGGDTLVLNDLRFGQMLGWQQPRGHFVFHYFLSHPTDNTLVVQRGRFKGWNKEVAMGLVWRIAGE